MAISKVSNTNQQGRLSMAAENYLVSIFQLDELRIRVTNTQLAEQLKRLPEREGLGTTLPSVGGMLRRLARDRLVELLPGKNIILTQRGKEVAEKLIRRQRLAKRMVVDLLGLEPHKAHEEAHRLEHAISDELAVKIAESLGNPTTCPFGHPIPGSGFVRDRLTVPLDKVKTGNTVNIDRIPEDDSELIKYLVENSIMPQNVAIIKDASPYRGVITLTANQNDVVISYEISKRIWVTPIGVYKKIN